MRHCWYCLVIVALSCAIVQCSASSKLTCELRVQRTVLPANKKVGEYCLVKVEVKFKIPRNHENCTLVEEPLVQLLGMKSINPKLKFNEGRAAAVADINACLVMENYLNYQEQKLSEVFNQQSYQLQIIFFAHNFVEEACRLTEECKSSLTVSIDQAPTVSIEVQSERNNQVAVVNPNDRIDVCCGACGKDSWQNVSLVTVTVTASDPDWPVVAATEELFKTNNTIQVYVKSATGLNISASKLQWMPYTKYTTKKQTNAVGITKLELTTEAMCEWLAQAVVQDDLSMTLSGFLVETEFLVDAVVETGVERGQLLSESAKWRGTVRFGNDLETSKPETMLDSNATENGEKEYAGRMQKPCADGSCDSILDSVGSFLGERGTLSLIAALIGLAALGLLCFVASIVSRQLRGPKSKSNPVIVRAVGTATALTGNQAIESNLPTSDEALYSYLLIPQRRSIGVQTGEEVSLLDASPADVPVDGEAEAEGEADGEAESEGEEPASAIAVPMELTEIEMHGNVTCVDDPVISQVDIDTAL